MKTKVAFCLLFFIIAGTLLTTVVIASDSKLVGQTDNLHFMDKISSDIFTRSERIGDKYSVIVFRKGIEQSTINEEIRRKTIFEPNHYLDSELYYSVKYPELASDVINIYGEKAAVTSISNEVGDEQFTPILRALHEDYDNFITAQRNVIRSSYNELNTSLLESFSIPDEDVIYQGLYTSTVAFYATQDTIFELSQRDDVEAILSCDFKKGSATQCSSEIVHEIIGTDSTTGTKSQVYNSGNGFKGNGIKIGIIEGGNGTFDPSSPQLASIVNSSLIKINNNASGIISDHATLVTSIIVGQQATYNGITYEGIVPNATVFFKSIISPYDCVESLNFMLNGGVSVVNYSGSTADIPDDYTRLEYEIDRIIQTTGVSFVNASGNCGESYPSHKVNTPGNAYNVITVGSLDTTTYNFGYQVAPTSCYEEISFLMGNTTFKTTEKPEIVAPGVNISCLGSGSSVITKSGTSFASPIVAGVIAQMQQCDPTLKTDYTGVKSILIASADFDIIAGEYPTPLNSNIYPKSGCGLVDAKKAIELVQSNVFATGTITAFGSGSVVPYNNKITLNLEAGQTLRAYMCFSRSDSGNYVFSPTSNCELFAIPIRDNFDLYLVRPGFDENSPDALARSKSVFNNMEIIDYEIQTTGNYVIWVKPTQIMGSAGGRVVQFSICWVIE